jgi:threonine dehydratase
VLGGGNIEPLLLADIVQRGMVRAGRLARVRVEARDLPGSLANITAIIAAQNANVEEVHHQRAFTQLTVQQVEINLVIKTRNAEHVGEIVAALCAAGLTATVA